MVKNIVEQVNLDEYDEEDFVDVGLEAFKQWLVDTHKTDIKKYPLSYLSKKYSREFAKSVGIEYPSYYGSGLMVYGRIGREMVRSEKVKLASLREDKSFLEKYKRGIEFFIKRQNLPSFIELKLTEEKPYHVTGKYVVDFQEMIKSPKYQVSPSTMGGKIKSFFHDYLGVEFGSPAHGMLIFNFNTKIEYVGKDPWIKYEFEKNIKKEIKKDPEIKSRVTRIKLQVHEDSFSIVVTLYYGYSAAWDSRRSILNKVEEIFRENGYNMDIIKIENA